RARGYILAVSLVAMISVPGAAHAAKCGNNASGFDAWKGEFSRQAAGRGIGNRGLKALAGTTYATSTIKADRGQRSFKLSLDQFMAKRGGRAIAAKGKTLKRQNAQLFGEIE